MKKWLFVIIVVNFFLCSKVMAQNKNLQTLFQKPPESAKPWVFWYWLNGNVSKEGISRDLEAMQRVGIGEALIANVKYREIPTGPVKMFTDEWWDLKTHALQKADSLGMKIGLFNCPGWSQAGGPWVKPEQAMRYLNATEFSVKGPQRIQLVFPKDTGVVEQKFLSDAYTFDKKRTTFQLVSMQAFPKPASDDVSINDNIESIICSGGRSNIDVLFDGSRNTKADLKGDAVTITVVLKQPQTVRSLQLIPADMPMTANCELQYDPGDGNWITISGFKIDRPNVLLMTGPVPFAPVSAGFDAIRSSKFRITIINEGTAKGDQVFGRLSEIQLSGAERLSYYAERQLIKMGSTENQTTINRITEGKPKPGNKEMLVDPSKIIDLSAYVDENGVLTWDCPKGEWIIQRTGMTPTGTHNHPVTAEGRGFEVDKMNEAHVASHFDSYIGAILKKIPPGKRKALRHVVVDSYEQGPENWTEGFDSLFVKTYGYDPVKWFPVLTGRIVESRNQSERFLWDVRRLVADQIAKNFTGTLRKKSEQNGLSLWLENYGHWGFPGEFLNYGKLTHEVSGEFWYNRSSLPNRFVMECRAASSAASIYGKQRVSAESFTSTDIHKNMPRDLKRKGDWAFAQGINHIVLHLYIHQPDDRQPGMNAWYGTDFNRNSTWFSQSKPFMDYFKRSATLLQQGRRVTDIAYFIGEDVPIVGGEQTLESPSGFDYDYLNEDVLMNYSSVKNGSLTLQSGASYRVLVLPRSGTMRPDLLRRLEQLVKDGLVIIGQRPYASPSLRNYPGCDKEVDQIASRMWSGLNHGSRAFKRYGKGWIFNTGELKEVLQQLKITPDMLLPESYVFSHRKASRSDIFFVSNQLDEERRDTIGFRVTGKQPFLFDAVTGKTRPLYQFREDEGTIYIPLQFAPAASWFIVFENQPGLPAANGKAVNFKDNKFLQEVNGDWNVAFNTTAGVSSKKQFSMLSDWSQSDISAVKYFSGTATYRNTFNFGGNISSSNYMLNLGRVEGLAAVRLNGVNLGVLWCYPYSTDISKALKKGRNILEIDITNPWWNRLIGDKREPQQYTWTAYANWSANAPLLPAGLLGPVIISKQPDK